MTSAAQATSRGRVVAPFDGAIPLRVGLRLERSIDFDRWVEIGRRLRAHEDASLWWLGDWLNLGQRLYGRRYRRGIELTGLEYQTLRNYALVARRFELSRRRDRLSFHHHAELCALPSREQDAWLDRAEAENWTRNELRDRLRGERRPDAPQASVALRLSVEPHSKARWEAAATVSGLPLHRWIVHALDTAAQQFLAEAD